MTLLLRWVFLAWTGACANVQALSIARRPAVIKDVFTADPVALVRGTPSVSMSVTTSVYGTKTR
jgi:hypothetical protein